MNGTIERGPAEGNRHTFGKSLVDTGIDLGTVTTLSVNGAHPSANPPGPGCECRTRPLP